MAWTGEGYGEENEDEEQLDLETINDVLAVTREDQEMLSEAHKALRREIKSIRKALKSLVRQFYAYADAQESESTIPEWSDVSTSLASSCTGDLPHQSSDVSANGVTNGDASSKATDNHADRQAVDIRRSHSFRDSDAVDNNGDSNHQAADIRRSQSFRYSDDDHQVEQNKGTSGGEPYDDNAFQAAPSRRSTHTVGNGHEIPANGHGRPAAQRHHHQPLVRSITQPVMRPSQDSSSLYLKEDVPQRSLSRNSVELYDEEVEDTALLLDDLELTQLSNTYPGNVSKSRSTNDENSDVESSHQAMKQSRSTTPSLRETGRKHAQRKFATSDLPNADFVNSYNNQNEFGNGRRSSDDNNGMIIPELKPQLVPSHLPPGVDHYHQIRASSQRTNGSNFHTAPRHHQNTQRLHKTKETDEPPHASPPPPPPRDNDDSSNVFLLSMEADHVGSLPEFGNSFRPLPRRLSSSEISAISGGVGGGNKRTKQIPRIAKLQKRSATQSHIAVTELVM